MTATSRIPASGDRVSSRAIVLRLAVAPAAFVLVFAIAQAARHAGVSVAFCVWKRFFALPCPACGVTTSIAAILEGSISRALEANVAGIFVLAFFLVQITLVLGAAGHVASEAVILRIARLSDRTLLAILLLLWLPRLS